MSTVVKPGAVVPIESARSAPDGASGGAVRLADFIAANAEPILAEWVTFAETCGAAGQAMDLVGLRDHALDMLTAIVADLRTPQTQREQTEKSKGNAEPRTDGAETAAEVHGAGRAESGFSVGEMVSEYRALRASVLRLWTRANGTLTGADVEDLMRFNEAIDQALAESVMRYTQDVDRSREMFIAILGHDLRTPLGAVVMGSQFMLDTGELVEPHLTLTTRILHSARRMNQMVGDLLDFTLGRLGSGVPITRGDMDLGAVVRHAVDEMSVARPESVVQFTATGDLRGCWDASRISQVATNLLGNAVQHGAPKTLIGVTAEGESAEVVLRMHNYGPAIPASELAGLFSPFKRVRRGMESGAAAARGSGNLGLGLYIAERIVSAHGGSMDVRSSAEAGTLFTVRLPR
ncbi:MAG TPA: sensor histidine kinase [Gemmatimonadaceae bacterium]|nr:sensor histidine kinase [Gemmatimonadaceae bacterium]